MTQKIHAPISVHKQPMTFLQASLTLMKCISHVFYLKLDDIGVRWILSTRIRFACVITMTNNPFLFKYWGLLP